MGFFLQTRWRIHPSSFSIHHCSSAGEGVVPRGLPLLCAAFAIRAGGEDQISYWSKIKVDPEIDRTPGLPPSFKLKGTETNHVISF